MKVRELSAILNSYDAQGFGDREVVLISKRTRRQWHPIELERCLNGDDSYLFECAEDFKGKIILE